MGGGSCELAHCLRSARLEKPTMDPKLTTGYTPCHTVVVAKSITAGLARTRNCVLPKLQQCSDDAWIKHTSPEDYCAALCCLPPTGRTEEPNLSDSLSTFECLVRQSTQPWYSMNEA